MSVGRGKLPDLDSNQDKQNQNLSYYPYTIRQSLNSAQKALFGVQKYNSQRIVPNLIGMQHIITPSHLNSAEKT